ncbi:MAG: hypothetical protein JOZ98_12725 [Solirubrobacterales bacterium]|nr:hypothetical protein [Solirubrobacterales bacterium]MBV9798781.1 hypothetical protein [Solirubrobacterales bacterium]
MSDDCFHDAAEELPFPYGAALRLERSGASDEVIAQALGIAPAGVPAALALARAKLAAIEAAHENPEAE